MDSTQILQGTQVVCEEFTQMTRNAQGVRYKYKDTAKITRISRNLQGIHEDYEDFTKTTRKNDGVYSITRIGITWILQELWRLVRFQKELTRIPKFTWTI